MINLRIRDKTQQGRIGIKSGRSLTDLLGILRTPSKGNPPPLSPPPNDKEHKPIRETRLENDRRLTRALPRLDPIL